MSKLPGRSTATQRQDVNLPSYHYPFFQPSEHAKLPTVKTPVISRVNTGKMLMLAKINTNGTTTAKSEKKVCLLSLPQSQLFVFKQTRFTKTKSEHREKDSSIQSTAWNTVFMKKGSSLPLHLGHM